MLNDPTYLGTVQDVAGATVRAVLEQETVAGLTFVAGRGYRIGQVGSYVRIPLGYYDLFGVISQVGAGAVPESLAETNPYGHRWMTVQLAGEGYRGGDFARGISQYPTVGDPVHLVTEPDLARIYGRPDSPNFVPVGHLTSAESIPALIDVDRLVTRHSAVVGATGSGKSTTVVSLLASLTRPDQYPSARVLVVDIHGEYAAALKDRAVVFRVNPDESKGEKALCIPYWAMTFDEFLALTLGPLEDAELGAVQEKVTELKEHSLALDARKGTTPDNLTVDTPVPFSVHQMWFDLHCETCATHKVVAGRPRSKETWALELNAEGNPVQAGDAMKVVPPRFRPAKDVKDDPDKIRLSQSRLNLRRQLDALASKLRDPRYDFLFRPGPWCPDVQGLPQQDLDSLLKEWLAGERPIAILDLSGVPVSILTELIGVLLRIIYDALFWARNLSEGGRERPLLVVLEEAHAYLGPTQSGAAAATVRRIVKEGRKYGIGALIVSQRPSEVDSTVLSQCGTLFALRLSNSTDRAHVTGATSDNLEGLFAMLPVLRIGEAIIVGEAVNLPVRTILDPPMPDRKPDSSDPLVYDKDGPGGWNRGREPDDYSDVVEVWRKQSPQSPRMV